MAACRSASTPCLIDARCVRLEGCNALDVYDMLTVTNASFKHEELARSDRP